MVFDGMISSDSHFTETPDLWTKRIDKRYRDRAPHLEEQPQSDWWYVDGYRLSSIMSGVDPGLRFEHPEAMRREGKFSEVIPGAYDPEAHIADMSRDGVAGEVFYPTLVRHFARLGDSAFLSAIYRAYNDWAAEFVRAHPDRYRAVAVINLDDVEDGISELRRARSLGLTAAMISVFPAQDKTYDLPLYDRFWATVQDLDMPISLHSATNRGQIDRSTKVDDKQAEAYHVHTPIAYLTVPHFIEITLAQIIFGGVFERYPKLKVVSVEHEIAWAGNWLRLMDYMYTQRARPEGMIRFQNSMLPSDVFHRNAFISFQEDALGMRMRDVVGVDNLMWGSDYPHPESTYPRSQEILASTLAGIPEAEQRKMVHGNAARVYGFAGAA